MSDERTAGTVAQPVTALVDRLTELDRTMSRGPWATADATAEAADIFGADGDHFIEVRWIPGRDNDHAADADGEWQAIAVADPGRMVTQHMADAHYGKAHDLVRRIFPELDSAAPAAPRSEAT